MKKVIGVKRLTFVELQTLILEIEVILNNRSLCADYDDDMEDVLTPNHMVVGKRLGDVVKEGTAEPERRERIRNGGRINLERRNT